MRKLGVATAVWLLIDLWRVWTPSLITIFGQAASTPPEAIGGFAIGCMVLPLILVAIGRRGWWHPRAMPALLVIAVLARVVLGCGTNGHVQLYVAAIGVVCAASYVCLAAARLGGDLVDGLLLGVALAATTQAALGGLNAVWRQDAWAWIEILALVVCTDVSLRRQVIADVPARRPLAWLVFPVLLVCGMTLANTGWASAAAGWWGPVAVVAGCWLALAVHRAGPAWPAAAVLVIVVGLDSLLTDASGATPAWAGVLPVLGMPALAVVLRSLSGAVPAAGVRPAPAAAGGALVWVLLLFGFYAGYDLGYTAPWIPLLVTLVVALVAGVAGRDPVPHAGPVLTARRAVAVLAVAVLVAALAPLVTLHGPGTRHSREQLRVLAYNTRMGYGLDGRYDVQHVADLINDQHADVVMLSEVDRAWLLNGGQDQLRILARLTGMHAVFGPASDQVWGEAILSRLPLTDVARHRYDSYGSLTGAEALQATVRWQHRSLRIISTHFQPTDDDLDKTTGQAGELAKLMTAAEGDYDAVVAGGDLNTRPGSAAWKVLTGTGYTDALAAARPLLTDPAGDPTDQIDHLFTTGAVTPTDPAAIDVRYSDHLPIRVDLRVG